MNNKAKCRVRLDLTDYLTHFIHTPHYAQNASPICYDYNENPVYAVNNPTYDSGYKLKQQSSFEVLKKILHDGLLRTGWSFRGENSPTIYGKRSAICFTEMPLYALAKYALNRNDISKVDRYGIAFNRRLLFRAGARPVIYGFSGSSVGNVYEKSTVAGYRLLDESTHISLREQYRFVRTEMYVDQNNDFDWMHEREWRWPLPVNEEQFPDHPDVPGLPIYWMPDCNIIVKTQAEKHELISLLRAFYQDPNWLFAKYKRNLLGWGVVAFDDIWLDAPEYKYDHKRIEDLELGIVQHIMD